MARRSKVEVSAVNLRIPSGMDRNYVSLIKEITCLKRGVRVFGDTYVAINRFDEDSKWGIISKYTEIDIDGDWFDVKDFDVASPEMVGEVVIPENLRPNWSAFYFKLDPNLHIVAFETYSESKSLSSRSVEKYFQEILRDEKIYSKFGYVEADIVKSYGEVDRIISLENLRELRIIIRRPNTDDMSEDLAAEIERRLSGQNAEEYEEVLKSKDSDGIKPDERTKKLSYVAAENGQVVGRSLMNGVMVTHDTKEVPFKEFETYNSEIRDARSVFSRLAEKVFSAISTSRSAASRQ